MPVALFAAAFYSSCVNSGYISSADFVVKFATMAAINRRCFSVSCCLSQVCRFNASGATVYPSLCLCGNHFILLRLLLLNLPIQSFIVYFSCFSQ